MPLDNFSMCGIMQHMKHLSKIGLAVLAAGVIALASFTNKAKADPQRPPPGAIVFAAQQYYEGGDPKSYIIYLVSQGAHAPKILPGTELAIAIETLLSQGFDVQNMPGTGLQFIAIRR